MSTKVKLPEGMGASFSVNGVEYEANKKGVADVADEHVAALVDFGVVPADASAAE